MAATVKGLKELNAKLARMPVAAKNAALNSVVQGATELVDMQKRLVAVDKGDLKNSLTVTPPGQTTPPYSQPGGQRTAGPLQAIVTAGNSKVRYAHLVEFGTAPHVNGGWAKGTKNPGYAPEAFFWPSYRALRTRIRSRISRSIGKAIKDEYSK